MDTISTTQWAPPSWPAPTPPPPPQPTKNHTGWKIIGGVVASLFVVGAIAGSSASSEDSGSVGTRSISMATWADRYGEPDSTMLADDMDSMARSAGDLDVAGMKSGCRTFQRHLSTAESHLPAPDSEVSSALTDAYTYYGQAASSCISGDYDTAGTYLKLGASATRRATAAIS